MTIRLNYPIYPDELVDKSTVDKVLHDVFCSVGVYWVMAGGKLCMSKLDDTYHDCWDESKKRVAQLNKSLANRRKYRNRRSVVWATHAMAS